MHGNAGIKMTMMIVMVEMISSHNIIILNLYAPAPNNLDSSSARFDYRCLIYFWF